MEGSRLDPLLPGESHTQLCIGDTIALCVQRGEKFCFVSSEGFVELGSTLREVDLASTVSWTHVDCMWMVMQKQQYDAQKAVRKAKKAKLASDASKEVAKSVAAGTSSTPGAASGVSRLFKRQSNSKGAAMGDLTDLLMSTRGSKAMQDQEREQREHDERVTALRTERLANAARNDEKRGTPLTYGETIQLMHVKSGKFLVFNAKRRSLALGCYSVRLPASAAPATPAARRAAPSRPSSLPSSRPSHDLACLPRMHAPTAACARPQRMREPTSPGAPSRSCCPPDRAAPRHAGAPRRGGIRGRLAAGRSAPLVPVRGRLGAQPRPAHAALGQAAALAACWTCALVALTHARAHVALDGCP